VHDDIASDVFQEFISGDVRIRVYMSDYGRVEEINLKGSGQLPS